MSGGFEAMGLMPELQMGVEEIGYLLPTEVQDEAIPHPRRRRRHGRGADGERKTAAFALPILELVHEKLREGERTGGPRAAPPRPGPAEQEDRDQTMAISDDGATCQSRSERWAGARANCGARGNGVVYYEVAVEDEGLVRVGWSTVAASYDLGTDAKGVGYGGTAKKSHARSFEAYGETYGKGDVVGCWLDLDSGSCGYTKNGADLGAAFAPLPANLAKEWLYPAVAMRNAQCSVNLGAAPFKHPRAGAVPFAAFAGLRYAAPKATAGAFETSKKSKNGGRGVSAIVLEPARDLAEQTHQCFEAYAKHVTGPSLNCALLIGGVNTKAAETALRNGDVDIVTGTPLKIWDLVKRGVVDCESSCRFFVLDEADRFIETDDTETCLNIFRKLPQGAAPGARDKRLQVCFFSATLHSDEVKQLAAKVCESPTWVDLKGESHLPDTVKHVVVPVDPTGADPAVLETKAYEPPAHVRGDAKSTYSPTPDACSEVLKLAKPALLVKLIDALKMDQVLVFCRTNLDCDLLERLVGQSGARNSRASATAARRAPTAAASSGAVHGRRRKNLEAFKAGSVKILVCTDVAARGIDVTGLPFVVNMTLPDLPENYVHRIGRVGRGQGRPRDLARRDGEGEGLVLPEGQKPPQKDTRPYDAGGNCVWYDEPTLLAAVEKKVKAKIPTMAAAECQLPENLRDVSFGDEANEQDQFTKASKLHRDAMADDVNALIDMETMAQRSFFALQVMAQGQPAGYEAMMLPVKPPTPPATTNKRGR
ncbi:DNA/RNA helicase [Aureococcus anophagefferens]|nr:DNA/RNA helicase [Aureococcus anophagefferens]